MMRRDERHVSWAEKVHQAEREAADARAARPLTTTTLPQGGCATDQGGPPTRGSPPTTTTTTRESTGRPVAPPVQQPQGITEDKRDEAMKADDNDNNDDMNIDYEATSAEEECGPSFEAEKDEEAPP